MMLCLRHKDAGRATFLMKVRNSDGDGVVMAITGCLWSSSKRGGGDGLVEREIDVG